MIVDSDVETLAYPKEHTLVYHVIVNQWGKDRVYIVNGIHAYSENILNGTLYIWPPPQKNVKLNDGGSFTELMRLEM